MTEHQYSEKEEKQEKEEEKRYEKQEKEEKTWEEKWRRDPLGTIVWALILIWTGVVLILNNLGTLDSFSDLIRRQTEWEIFDLGPVALIFLGAGVLVLLEVLVRLLVPTYRRPVGGTLVFAAILLGIGLGMIWSWDVVWPIVLIAIGAGILLSGLFQRR